jgi:glucosamine-6-phosphate deaminase
VKFKNLKTFYIHPTFQIPTPSPTSYPILFPPGWNVPNITHLRLGFYTSDIFAPEPTLDRDVAPILQLLRKVEPDVVTVALDPEASGPDTHYKVLQAVTKAVEKFCTKTVQTVVEDEEGGGDLNKADLSVTSSSNTNSTPGKTTVTQKTVTETIVTRPNMKVWGYRNVWFTFEPFEVNRILPVSVQMMATLDDMFMNSFESQRDAQFPAYEIEGPFCKMSRKVQTEQYEMVKTCLGREWFQEHRSPLIRATRGLVFLKEMTVGELQQSSRELRHLTESTTSTYH